MAIKTFKRHELKYFVTSEQYELLKYELEFYMVPDEYCKENQSYMIYNLYFDTKEDDIIRHSLSKPYYKEKLRLRSYKLVTASEDKIFLELKKKIGGIVSKRRAVLSYEEAMKFILSGKRPEVNSAQDEQVIEEIAYFLETHEVKPKVYISYERNAYFDAEDREFRISFDCQILTRRKQVSLTDEDYGAELIDDGQYLMEVKCLGALPLWLCHQLSVLGIRKTSFSKYGAEYKNYLEQRQYQWVEGFREAPNDLIIGPQHFRAS